MPCFGELSVLDLLKAQIPRFPNDLHPLSVLGSTSPCSPVHDKDDLMRGLFTGEIEETEKTKSNAVSQQFFGISLNKEVSSGMGHLSQFIQSQLNSQEKGLEAEKPPELTCSPKQLNQNDPNPHFSSYTLSCKNPSQILLTNLISNLSTVKEKEVKRRASFVSLNTLDSSPHSSSQKPPIFSPSNIPGLEFYPSPSNFYRETQKENRILEKCEKSNYMVKRDIKEDAKCNRDEDINSNQPFISTDNQENRDTEHPQWKEIERLNTLQKRYEITRKFWKTPSMPDPNKNITSFCIAYFKAMRYRHSTVLDRRRNKRLCEMDEDLQPPRKRQRRFENLDFSIRHVTTSKAKVQNEYLEAQKTSRMTSMKLESLHREKQSMLDLACEEMRAIHQFYIGVPDPDLTVTQWEMERGLQAREHVYKVFGQVYGYKGQEFFP